jgi:hypothetical protein
MKGTLFRNGPQLADSAIDEAGPLESATSDISAAKGGKNGRFTLTPRVSDACYLQTSMKKVPLDFSGLGRTAVLSVLVLSIASAQELGQGGDEALRERFVQEAPARWEEYARLSEGLQGVLSVLHTGTLNDYQYQSLMEYKTNGRGTVLKVGTKHSLKGNVEKEDEEVFGLNPGYGFTLSRKSPSSPWVLTNLFELGNKNQLGRVTFRINDYLACVSSGVRLDNEPLAEVLRKPGFRIGHCRKVRRDSEELVDVTFTYSKEEANRKKRTLNGTVVFDPNRYWCLRSGDIQVTGDFVSGSQKIQVTQSDNAGALPPVSRVCESDGDWISSAGSRNRQRIRYEVTLSQPTRLPSDREFTLSAFGLPEPPGLGRAPTPWYLWAAVLGFVCLGLAVFLRWRARRAERVTASRSTA